MGTLLVAGATGSLGRQVVLLARQRGLQVRALGRRRQALDALGANEVVVAEPRSDQGLDQAMNGVDVVVSALGASVSPEFGKGYRGFEAVDTPANLALIRAAQHARVKRFVYVSLAHPPELAELAYVRAHETVAAALAHSTLDHAVLRPTGFFSAFGALVAMAARGSLPLVGDPNAKTNPIAELDLAEQCIALAQEPVLAGKSIELGGPEVFTRREIAELAFEARGAKGRIRALPNAVVTSLAWLMRPLNPRVSDLLRFVLAVSSRDCVAPALGRRRLSEYFRELAVPTR